MDKLNAPDRIHRWIVSSLIAGVLFLCSATPALAWCAYPGDPECPAQEPPTPDAGTDVTDTVRFVVDDTVCPAGKVINLHDRLFIQLRSFAECLGLHVDWSNRERHADIYGPERPDIPARAVHVRFRPGSALAEQYNPFDRVSDPKAGPRSYWDMGYLHPIIVDDRMMLPFRFVTDVWNRNVQWVENPNGDGVNEVRVQTYKPAEPIGIINALQYVRVNRAGRFEVMGQTWAAMPSAIRWVQEMVRTSNATVDRLRREFATGAPTIAFDKGRVEIPTEFGSVHVYAYHQVYWFHDGKMLDDYVKSLENTDFVKKIATDLVAGAGGLLTKIPVAAALLPYYGAASVVYHSTEAVLKHFNHQRHKTCVTDASSAWYDKSRMFHGFTVGFVYGAAVVDGLGFQCRTEYTDDVITP